MTMHRTTKKLTATVSAALILNLCSLTACTEIPAQDDQAVDDCPGTIYIVTDESETAANLGISFYRVSAPGPDRLSLDVVGIEGELVGHLDITSDESLGGHVTANVTGDPSRYELIFSADGMVATMDGREAGRWSRTDEGVVPIGELLPGSELGIAIATTATGNVLDSNAPFGFEASWWDCTKLTAKAAAFGFLCVSSAVAAGFICETVVACVAAAAGAVIACLNYVETSKEAADACL
jgi:hypothetical protein